ncbi:DUF3108 domain-containing protein [Skermanella sp. TT6]|uniref:DUF3108 domain-containing protein n=1 Tax=Skermanella cutis TaxID=2775420 RepID=A0ABX7B2F9_9PROT|nr:DUF3108 domain-containing protein [Skermanella sp. TT6]QQP88512.1 DUF3108 domain-containing protein [Skermanella sp. TT6]
MFDPRKVFGAMPTSLRSIPAVFLVGGAVAALAPAAAAAEKVRLGYAVYAGGFEILQASILLDVGRDDYEVEVSAETQGLIGTFFPWRNLSRSAGLIREGEAEPRSHRQSGTWRGRERAVSLDYDGSGGVTADVRPPDDPAERDPVPPEMVPGTTDPLSAVLSVATGVASGRGCTGTVPVFDGRRRYDLNFRTVGNRQLFANDYSVFSGPAVHCEVTSTVLAGQWKQDGVITDREKRAPIALMLAPVVEGLPPVPVRLEGESRFGDVIMHLTSADTVP